MQNIAPNILHAVGHVPTVRLNAINAICKTKNLYLKLESLNPGGSIKDKNATYLIEYAEKNGLLSRNGTIIESSSGNFGIGLAMVGAIKGYRVWIVVDAKTPPFTRRLLTAYGAVLIDVPLSEADANGSMQIARMRKARELAAKTPGAWYPCQHQNPENPTAHNIHTAHEILKDFEGSPPQAIVIGISTAGQITGIGSYFKQHHPQTKIIGVDVAGSMILGTPPHPYKMIGLGLSFRPPQFDGNLIDAAYSVSDSLAFSVCRALAQKEGLLLGASTGAIVAAGIAYAAQSDQIQSILMINPDRGDRYLETLYNDQWIQNQGLHVLIENDLQDHIQRLKPIPTSYFRDEKPTHEIQIPSYHENTVERVSSSVAQ